MGVYWYIVSPSTQEAFELGKLDVASLSYLVMTCPVSAAFISSHKDSKLVNDLGDLPWDEERGWTMVGSRLPTAGFLPYKLYP